MFSPSPFEATLTCMLNYSQGLHKTYTDQRAEGFLQNKNHMKLRKLMTLLNSNTTLKISKSGVSGQAAQPVPLA